MESGGGGSLEATEGLLGGADSLPEAGYMPLLWHQPKWLCDFLEQCSVGWCRNGKIDACGDPGVGFCGEVWQKFKGERELRLGGKE